MALEQPYEKKNKLPGIYAVIVSLSELEASLWGWETREMTNSPIYNRALPGVVSSCQCLSLLKEQFILSEMLGLFFSFPVLIPCNLITSTTHMLCTVRHV